MTSKNPKKTVTVAVVEDNADLCASVRGILDTADGMRCVAVCTTGEEALIQLPPISPDVIFMDINLPGMSGVECVRHLAESLPQSLIVMLTIRSNIDAVFASLQAGACGYLHKPVRADDVIASVREVMAGGSPMSAAIARKVVQSFKAQPASRPENEINLLLTERERTVLEYLSEGYIYKEIAEEMKVSWHTVHNHIRHIYEKLQVRSRSQAVAKFRGN
jgi:DNA-binding NarL/FixJ family response regulator